MAAICSRSSEPETTTMLILFAMGIAPTPGAPCEILKRRYWARGAARV